MKMRGFCDFCSGMDGLTFQFATKPATKATRAMCFSVPIGVVPMGRKFLMAWIPSRRGWMKECKGQKYAVVAAS